MDANWSNLTPRDLLHAFLNRPMNTSRAYASDLFHFSHYLGLNGNLAAVEAFINMPRGKAKYTLDMYREEMRTDGASLNTIRRRCGAMLGLLRLAHEYEIIPWAIRGFSLPTPQPLRDTRGPSRRVILDMIARCKQRGDGKGFRDAALFSLLYYNALRIGEVLSLDIKSVRFDTGELEILAKGLWESTLVPIPLETIDALKFWLASRGMEDGPLFINLHPGKAWRGKRLEYIGARKIIREVADDIGYDRPLRPHGFRHSAATHIAELTNGNVNFGMALTRHRDPKTLMIYNDPRVGMARQAVEILSYGMPIVEWDTPNDDDTESPINMQKRKYK